MRFLCICDDDCNTIAAILRTHAEMQDQRINEIGPILTRLKLKEPVAAAQTILDLEDQLFIFEDDAEDLKRLANIIKPN